jgi:predicted Zn-ribbon and HTH transcriptional regulator
MSDEMFSPLTLMQSSRKYHKGERGLETLERKYIDSIKLQRYLTKLSNYFNVEFEKPKFRPVYINKRLTRCGGTFNGNYIDISSSEHKLSQKSILWHEILHAVVRDNFEKVGDGTWKQYKHVEKAVFLLDKHGEHHAFHYQLKCNCGYWWKSVNKKKSTHCPRCDKILVSITEYNKIKKMSKEKSNVIKINIERYKPWESNKNISGGIK